MTVVVVVVVVVVVIVIVVVVYCEKLNDGCGVQLDLALKTVVGRRLGGWYRPLVFSNGSIVTSTGFTIYRVLSNGTTELIKDSITDTLLDANTSFLVDRNTIRIIGEFQGMCLRLRSVNRHAAHRSSLSTQHLRSSGFFDCGLNGLKLVTRRTHRSGA